MKDGIIKADGTSRLMRATLPATYEAFRAAAAAGTLPLDILFNSVGWRQQPDFLNKASLLKDATAALFDLTETAVPDDALAFLGKYNLYWWQRRSEDGDWEYVAADNRNAYPDSGLLDSDGFEYLYLGIPFDKAVKAVSVEVGAYIGTGTYGASNPVVLTFSSRPELVLIAAVGSSERFLWIDLDNDPGGYGYASINTVTAATNSQDYQASLDGNTLRIWAERGGNAYEQANAASRTYHYFAICR